MVPYSHGGDILITDLSEEAELLQQETSDTTDG